MLGQNKSLKGKLCFVTVKLAKRTEHLGFLALNKGLINQFVSQTDATAAIGEPEQAHKAHNMAASNKPLFSFV